MPKPYSKPQRSQQGQHQTDHYQQQQQQNMTNIQHESQQLQVQLVQQSNELDSIIKVEQSMNVITSLLSQFADLVTEQQQDIVCIHETTSKAKYNVAKGKDNLIDATERTKQSKHYMAS